MVRTFSLLMLSALLACGTAHGADSAARELQLRQQQDALNFSLQQGMRSRRYELAPADQRRLDQLELDQRLQYQQLEQQQIRRDDLLRRHPGAFPDGAGDAQVRAQREIFSQERTLQMQQFDLDRQRLLQSAPREPLQSPAGGMLRLP
jgi:hypothetical protein